MSTIHHVYSNSWHHDLHIDMTGTIRTMTSFLRSGTIADKFNNNQNLLVGVSNLEWYADRLDTIADNLDSYHARLTDEDEVQSKVVSLFENQS
jgi:hypothetical protein